MQEVNTEVANRLKRLSQTVKIHGFRPGKVPVKIVEQQYGGQVRQEVLGDTIQKSFGDAVREQNLRVAGLPKIDVHSSDDTTDKFEYTATFEVYPEVVLGDLTALSIERPVAEIGEAEIDKTLEVLRKQRTVFEPVERAAESGDQVKMDFRGTIDGEAFDGGTAEGAVMQLGEGRLLPEFETNVIGLKAGESTTFTMKFPDDYHGKDVAGKEAQFEIKVQEVLGPRLPEIDSEFAKSLGVEDGDLEKMRSEIRGNLEREVSRRASAKVKEQIMKGLSDTATVDLPQALVDQEIERLTEQMKQDLRSRGVNTENVPLPGDAFEEEAKRRVRLGLIVQEVVSKHGIAAKPDQVKQVVEEQAQAYEKPDEVRRWYYQSPDRLREIESIVLEANLVEWVAGQAKVEDKPTPFDDLMGSGQ
jgi:trigger factor